MLFNYLKVALRTIFKHKSFSLINILGLSIGMPVCLLTILVISGQQDLDQFQVKKNRIFRIVTHILGIAIYSTETRTKEIGVRKVFGASVGAIVLLLSRDLVRLLLVAVLAATPLVWAFINFMFLERIAFRFDLGAGVFLAALAIVTISAFITIGSQTIKVANSNPVNALKNE